MQVLASKYSFHIRLFKENPDLEGDSLKVVRERRELISEFEVIFKLFKNRILLV
jgi:hypothetical protein